MFSLLRSATAFLIATASLVQGYADPGACSGACWGHDPSVIQRSSDNLYFKFNTGSGIQIATASSLSGPWTNQGYALASGSKISVTGNTGTDLWVRSKYPPHVNVPLINKHLGPRCSQGWRSLLHVLCRLDIRIAGQCNRSRDQQHDGGRFLDRPRSYWNCIEFFKTLQRD